MRAYDITCSAPKSVSLLWATGDEQVRRQVLDAHDSAVAAVVDWVERHAHCRYRVSGQVQIFDAEGIVAALFRQHTSRALDPQLHTHVVIANRVRSPDGRWLALDARTIKHDQRTLSALYHAGLRTELTHRLGVRWHEPVNGIAELVDVPDELRGGFSQRTREVDERLEAKLERFVDTYGREPTPRERWRLERDAVTDSRPTKTSPDASALRHEWLEQLRALGMTPEQLLGDTVGRVSAMPELDPPGWDAVVAEALTSLAEQQSTWRPAELVRELAAAVPSNLGVPAESLAQRLDHLADDVIDERCIDLSRPVPAGAARRRDGRPTTESALDRVLTLPDILAQEERLLGLAEQRLERPAADNPVVAEIDEALGGAQLEVAAAIAGDRALVLVVGPAGTGKTTSLRPAVEQLRLDGRAVFGVAPSATAAEVLAVDTGLASDTLDKLLIEHRLDRPPDHRYDLPACSTVLVDEAAMVSTPKLAALFDLAERRSWRLALVGDPLQFAAVGRGGMFAHLVDTFGAIELGRVHRFANDWECEASLRLRRGDLGVGEVYEANGRLHGGTAIRMRGAIVNAWWHATQAGQTALMLAPTTELVALLNDRAQRRRIEVGAIDPAGPVVDVGPYGIHVGDVVATRRNARDLRTDRQLMVKNRDRWTVAVVHRNGSLTVEGGTGRVHLPADYVSEHVELAYAQTSHAAQGRTVDRSFLFLDGATDARGIYVPMTRGRETNEVFVVTRGEETAADIVTESLTRSWIDRPAVVRRAELVGPTPGDGNGGRVPDMARPLGPKTLRQLLERAFAIDHSLEMTRYEIDWCRRALQQLEGRRRSLLGSIEEHRARLQEAQRTLAEYDRPLVRRRHRHEVETARNQLDWVPRAIEHDQRKLREVNAEEAQTKEKLQRALEQGDRHTELVGERNAIAQRLTEDRSSRAATASHELPPHLVDRLGPRPIRAAAAAVWDDAAGRLAQHHVTFEQSTTTLQVQQPRPFCDSAYATSRRAADEALERLDRALGRQPAVEPPHRSLGLSL